MCLGKSCDCNTDSKFRLLISMAVYSPDVSEHQYLH